MASNPTYIGQTKNKNAKITIVVSGPMRAGKSFVKKQIEAFIKNNKELFWYEPEMIVIEGDILEHEKALKLL